MYEQLLLKTCEQTKEKWRQNLLFVWSGSIIKIKFLGQFPPWTIAPVQFLPGQLPPGQLPPGQLLPGQLPLRAIAPRIIPT